MQSLLVQHPLNRNTNPPLLLVKLVIIIIGITMFAGCITRPPEKTYTTSQTTSAKYKNPPTKKPKGLSTFKKVTNKARNCLSLAMYWEALGEGDQGMLAVGSVVLNRVENQQFPNSICGVVHEGGETPPCQFSWWCDGKSDHPRNRRQWQAALNIADKLLSNQLHDPTGGALFFHSTRVRPSFHRTRQRTAHIGNHIFYR
jgi:spore germination cell wall hydrolase CwlJ-like protein